MPIHCKTDMLLIPPRSTSQNQFFFPSFVYLHSVYLFFFSFSPLVHTHTKSYSTQNNTPTGQIRNAHVQAERLTCGQEQTHTSLLYKPTSAQAHTHMHIAHTLQPPSRIHMYVFTHMHANTPLPFKSLRTHIHTHAHTRTHAHTHPLFS